MIVSNAYRMCSIFCMALMAVAKPEGHQYMETTIEGKMMKRLEKKGRRFRSYERIVNRIGCGQEHGTIDLLWHLTLTLTHCVSNNDDAKF